MSFCNHNPGCAHVCVGLKLCVYVFLLQSAIHIILISNCPAFYVLLIHLKQTQNS